MQSTCPIKKTPIVLLIVLGTKVLICLLYFRLMFIEFGREKSLVSSSTCFSWCGNNYCMTSSISSYRASSSNSFYFPLHRGTKVLGSRWLALILTKQGLCMRKAIIVSSSRRHHLHASSYYSCTAAVSAVQSYNYIFTYVLYHSLILMLFDGYF